MEETKLYQKMFAVMSESEAIEKNMTVGKGSNAYKAVSEASMLNMVKPLFKKYKLVIFPIDADIKEIVNVYNKTDYEGKSSEAIRAITQIKVTYRIADTETGEYQDVIGLGNGADSQDKGAGKAFTYSLKNALSKTFMLFSGEDTDNEHSDDIGNEKANGKKQEYKNPPVNGQDLPPYEPKGSKQERAGMASKVQLESIQLAAGGDLGIIKKGLAVFGYKSGKEVQAKDVDGIIDIIGQMIVTGND